MLKFIFMHISAESAMCHDAAQLHGMTVREDSLAVERPELIIIAEQDHRASQEQTGKLIQHIAGQDGPYTVLMEGLGRGSVTVDEVIRADYDPSPSLREFYGLPENTKILSWDDKRLYWLASLIMHREAYVERSIAQQRSTISAQEHQLAHPSALRKTMRRIGLPDALPGAIQLEQAQLARYERAYTKLQATDEKYVVEQRNSSLVATVRHERERTSNLLFVVAGAAHVTDGGLLAQLSDIPLAVIDQQPVPMTSEELAGYYMLSDTQYRVTKRLWLASTPSWQVHAPEVT